MPAVTEAPRILVFDRPGVGCGFVPLPADDAAAVPMVERLASASHVTDATWLVVAAPPGGTVTDVDARRTLEESR
jgi:hypothetical protein